MEKGGGDLLFFTESREAFPSVILLRIKTGTKSYKWAPNVNTLVELPTSPEKACPLRRCSDPWLSSLPKCSRISSSRWLYVMGPPEMLTKCSLSRRRETCLPVLYMVPLTYKAMGNRSDMVFSFHFSPNPERCMVDPCHFCNTSE